MEQNLENDMESWSMQRFFLDLGLSCSYQSSYMTSVYHSTIILKIQGTWGHAAFQGFPVSP